ncbi:chemotaxis protein CheW [Actinoplanes sp. NEAU-A12]|uniref:Chemotaxis protein CheW n=1 Tax=Actinoplanes sandaracinus TaxID=3045177 RepID=A0ABT6WU72_9ACTN|nr:chemotaxis protein CheW [Actinoplanes sandaracinus]MDI6103298.1 chemotaxis protein CheW [Actinoplanes sandaracinus]
MDAAEHDDYVTFDVAGERYAVPARRVREIIRMPAVVKVPFGPPSLEGLADLRGRVLPVVSLRSRRARDRAGHDETSRVIVVDGDVPLGFVVDRVSGVIRCDPRQVQPASSVRPADRSGVLAGVIKSRGGMTTVLDVDNLIGGRFPRLSGKRSTRDGSPPARGGPPGPAADAPARPGGPASPREGRPDVVTGAVGTLPPPDTSPGAGRC